MKPKKLFKGSISANRGTLKIKFKGKVVYTGIKNTPEGRKLCQEILNQINLESLQNEGYTLPQKIVKKSTPYISEVFNEWIEHLYFTNKSPKTIHSYKSSFNKIIKSNYQISEERIKKDVEQFVYSNEKYSSEHGQDDVTVENYYSNNSKNIYLRSFQVFLNYCHENNILPELKYFKKYKLPVNQKEIVLYSNPEFNTNVNALKMIDREFALLLQFMMLTGGRISETLNLKWNDIDLSNLVIKFPNKIKKSIIQEIPIQNDLLPILKELKEITMKRKIGDKQLKVFRWEVSSKSRLTRRLNEVQTAMGIKKEGRAFHSLRKTFLSSLANQDLNLIELTQLARHSSIETTREFYIKLNQRNLAEKLNRISEQKKIKK